MFNTQALTQLSASILKLHKALLDDQKHQLEISTGKELSPYEFLDAALNHEDFAWLKPLSQMLVKIDLAIENLRDNETHALEAANSPAFDGNEIKEYWQNPSATFQNKMIQAIQNNPDISFLFSDVRLKASAI